MIKNGSNIHVFFKTQTDSRSWIYIKIKIIKNLQGIKFLFNVFVANAWSKLFLSMAVITFQSADPLYVKESFIYLVLKRGTSNESHVLRAYLESRLLAILVQRMPGSLPLNALLYIFKNIDLVIKKECEPLGMF